MESIGEKIKKFRLEKGISLEEARKKTKINTNILKAIEGDGLTDLSPVYLKGFIKIYCKFLGFNFDVGTKQSPPPVFDVGTEQCSVPVKRKEPQDTAVISANVKDAPCSRVQENPAPRAKAQYFKEPKIKLGISGFFDKIKTGLMTVLIIIIGVAAIWACLSYIKNKKGRSVYSGPIVKSVTKSAAKSSAKQKAAVLPKRVDIKQNVRVKAVDVISNPITSPVKEAVSGIRLGMRTRENCWVSLKADGRSVFHRVLEKGRSESWQAKDKMELALGNAGVVELEVNGQIFSKLGKRGQALKNILITKEGLDIGR